jgi:hypothetical protein
MGNEITVSKDTERNERGGRSNGGNDSSLRSYNKDFR